MKQVRRGSTSRLLRSVAAGAVLLGASACELAEVTTVAGEDILVVEAVLRTDRDAQILLLHRSISGGVVQGEPTARVVVRTPRGGEVVFRLESPGICADRYSRIEELEIQPSCYLSDPEYGGWVAPGETYQLHIETADGKVVRGQTTVPGAFSLHTPSLDPGDDPGTCEITPRTPLPLTWSPSSGAWSYLADLEIHNLAQVLAGTGIKAPDPLSLTGLAISEEDTTLILPGDFGLFERADQDQELFRILREGFPGGAFAFLTLTAADRNYVNAVRGGTFNPSGVVRIPSVTGDGVGVFASLVPIELTILVPPGLEAPDCPVYDPGGLDL